MAESDPDLNLSRKFAAPQRPRDAATLIIVRRDGPSARMLLGERHSAHAFLPGKFVFPGGRLDPNDLHMRPAGDLAEGTLEKLMAQAKGKPSRHWARGLALAAVRETFEETGLIVGRSHDGFALACGEAWRLFLATGYAPDLSGLTYFARAITPPGRTRRFDSRFFVVTAGAVANLDAPLPPSAEFVAVQWASFDQAYALDLPRITADILKRLETVMEQQGWPAQSDPVSFQYQHRGVWREEMI